MKPFEDPNHLGNSPEYRTGETCINEGCEQPAGTWWSPWYCFSCNVERMRGIRAAVDRITQTGGDDE